MASLWAHRNSGAATGICTNLPDIDHWCDFATLVQAVTAKPDLQVARVHANPLLTTECNGLSQAQDRIGACTSAALYSNRIVNQHRSCERLHQFSQGVHLSRRASIKMSTSLMFVASPLLAPQQLCPAERRMPDLFKVLSLHYLSDGDVGPRTIDLGRISATGKMRC